jgi:hypothetical protein
MVSTLGRNRLKVLVQVNTSGEECKFSLKQRVTQSPCYIFWYEADPYLGICNPYGVCCDLYVSASL